MDASQFTPSALAEKLRDAGISESYASLISRGLRDPSAPLAIDIFRKTGLRFPPIADATDDEINTLERMVGRGKARQKRGDA